MQRLIIFQYYSYRDKAEEYILYLINSFREIANKILVVSNSKLDVEDREKIERLSDEYIEREDIGYDAGVFIDFFKQNSKEQVSLWDEVVLVNSSFLGPLYSWKKVFEKMDGVTCDFWGLSRHKGGDELLMNKVPIEPHVQSYFIVIRKTILEDDRFYRFWGEMEYPQNYLDTIIKFEFGFTRYFSQLGYSYTSFLDQSAVGKGLIERGEQVLDKDHFEIVRDCDFPIVKYRFIDLCHYKQAKKILDYVDQHTEYDASMITDYMSVLEQSGMFLFDREQLLKFAKKYWENIYLFGHGLYAQNLTCFLNDNGYRVQSYIVSNPIQKGEISLGEIGDFEQKGVIVALGRTAWAEVKHTIINSIPADHCLLPKV